MPRRALRCVVDLNIQKISAPGVWLPSREDLYVSISLFGQFRNTQNVSSAFPLTFYEPLRFEKTYYTAVNPRDVAELLEDELIVIELLQYSDYSDGCIRLASYSTCAREFLFPYPTLCPAYTSTPREILLSRTIAWPGISPKLEFTTTTVIKDSHSPELDALEDALEEEKLARRARSRSRSCSLSRSRSLSGSRIYRFKAGAHHSNDEDSSADMNTGNKVPFVVRHLDNNLIGRIPGAPPAKPQLLKEKKNTKSRSLNSRPSSSLSEYDSSDDVPRPHTPRLQVKEVIRDAFGALPVFTTKYMSTDKVVEVGSLASSRSFNKESELAKLQKARIRACASEARSRSPSPLRYAPILQGSLEDLALDTSIVKNRSSVHLDAGQYWTERAAELSGISHRDVFNNNMNKMYNGLLRNAVSQQQKNKIT